MKGKVEAKKIIYLRKCLRVVASLLLKKYKPKIISITGSVGKTSAKEAVFLVLSAKYRVRRSDKNYNNEIGLPLTIIGEESGGGSIWGWLKVFLKGIAFVVLPLRYPEVLVLEMGADRPGDIKYLTNFVSSDVGIVTEVSTSHIEFFKTIENIAKEKMSLVKSLRPEALAIINVDNTQIVQLQDQIVARVLTYGFSSGAEIRATDLTVNYADGTEVRGLSFKLSHKGTTLPVRLNNILAKHQVYAALAAAGVGLELGLNLVEIADALANLTVPCGRLNLLGGIKNTAIIDDTYNASPISTVAALEVLGDIKAKRKIAVLGDMLELGEETENGHREVARKFLAIQGDLFFAVGAKMELAVAELRAAGFAAENIFSFADPMQAGKELQKVLRSGDVVLVKGSQGLRMEKVVEEVMAEPQRAGELLCRQSAKWKKTPFRAN